MSATPPTPNTDFLGGQECALVLDGGAYTYAVVVEHDFTKVDLDLVADGISINGPRTFTLDLLGPKIPCKVTVTVNNATGGYPGVDTPTSYDFGPSLTTQSITLANSNYTFTRLVVSRRF